MKKFLVALFILTIISIGVGLFLMQKSEVDSSDPRDAIPTSAALIITYPDINAAWQLFEDQDYFDLLSTVKELQGFYSKNEFIDSLLRHDKDVAKLLDGAVIWSSYHPIVGDSIHAFHSIRMDNFNQKLISKTLKKVMQSEGSVTELLVNGQSVSELGLTDSDEVLFYTVKNGLILTSTSLELIQSSLSQLESGNSLNADPGFVTATASAGKNVEANLYINYKYLPHYMASYIKPGVYSAPEILVDLGSWTEMDINLKANGITFNGFTYSTDSLPQYLNLFLNQKPQPVSFPEILPSNTSSFIFYGISDVLELASDIRTLLDQKGQLTSTEARLDSVNELYDIDLEQNLLAWVGTEFGICVTQPKSTAFAEQSFLVFKARSIPLADKLLKDLSGILSEKKGVAPDTFSINETEIHRLHLTEVLTELLGDEFEQFESLYYMILEDYVVFGMTKTSMADFLQRVTADRTLDKDLQFSKFTENLSSNFNIFTYHHLTRSRHILESYLNRDAALALRNNQDVINEFEAVGSQIASTGKSFYSNLFLRYDPNWEADKETNWIAKMGSKAKTSPIFVKNHLNGADEILVQDESNVLYLFNQVGQSLFETELAEPILNRPKQVDAFKNGKLQYIFNTKNFIYLVDRNGKNVDGFPIELKAPAETDLAVFDYDNNHTYRLLITCTNNRIYNYDIKGEKISGWKHNKASDPTIQPFKHLYHSGKDYLVTGESNGKIHLLDRRGKNRLKVKKRVISSKKNHLQTFMSSEKAFTGVYLTDENGIIHRVSLTGDVQQLNLGRYSPEHHFMVADLNKNGRPEFIFSDLNILRVFNYKKELVFEKRLDPSASEPFYMELEDGIAIGFCYKDQEQLVLFDSSGDMVKGFPASGSSIFDMKQTEKGLLVVSSATHSLLSIQAIN